MPGLQVERSRGFRIPYSAEKVGNPTQENPFRFTNQGAGGLPVLSLTAIRMLSESKPYGSIKHDAEVADHFLISFHPEIDEPKLRKIYDDIKNGITIDIIKELEESRIIFFIASYD